MGVDVFSKVVPVINKKEESYKITDVFRGSSVHRDDLFFASTGEALSDVDGVRVTSVEKTGLSEIRFNDFGMFCSGQIGWLSSVLSDHELGKLLLMGMTTKTVFNVLYNGNNRPHTARTLASYLGYRSVTSIYPLLDKFESLNIILSLNVSIGGKRNRIFHMNPFISRKRKGVSSALIEMFEKGDGDAFELTEEGISKDVEEMIEHFDLNKAIEESFDMGTLNWSDEQ